MAKRAKIGDILEVRTAKGRFYLHFIGKHPLLGDAVAVLPMVSQERRDMRTLSFQEGYVTCYPAGAAVNRGLVEVVGNVPSPGVPKHWRRQLGRTWAVSTENGEVRREVLTPDERKLPIEGIWNHDFLIERVLSSWRPESEVQIPIPRPRVAAQRPPGTAIRHYFYVGTKGDAATLASELRERGFSTEETRGSGDAKWLVLARKEGPHLVGDLASPGSLEALATKHRGEYDGWEAEVAKEA